MTARGPEGEPNALQASASDAPLGFHRSALGQAGAGARLPTRLVTISRRRRAAFGPPSCERRPCTTTAARSSPAWKNSWSASILSATGMWPAASAILPSAEMMAKASIRLGAGMPSGERSEYGQVFQQGNNADDDHDDAHDLLG